MLLIQGADGDGQQAGEDRQIGACPGALARRKTLAHRQRDPGEAERESDPLKCADDLAEQDTPEQRGDDRHGTDHECDQPYVHAVGGGPVERSELKPQLQGADQSGVYRRAPAWPGDPAEPGNRGEDQSRATEAQHEHGERTSMIECDPGCRITRAPKQHERNAEQAGRHAGAGVAFRRGTADRHYSLLVHCRLHELAEGPYTASRVPSVLPSPRQTHETSIAAPQGHASLDTRARRNSPRSGGQPRGLLGSSVSIFGGIASTETSEPPTAAGATRGAQSDASG